MTGKQEVLVDDKQTFRAIQTVHKHIQLLPGD